MSVALAGALLVPWIFWGVFMGLLFMAGRSWINVLLIPFGITVVILVAASFTSGRDVFRASLILHVLLLVFFLVSYISFVFRERKKKR